MKRILFLLLMLSACLTKTHSTDEWIQLFNGKDLRGWKILNGNAEIRVDNNQIIGKSVENTPNTFLCSEQHFRNFILEFDVMIENNLNSGVQIRSNSNDEYRNGVVYGYQIEIDPTQRAYSGGIFDEQRRGWLYNLEENKKGQDAFRINEWNNFHVEAIEDTIRTWVNSVQCASLIDSISDSGFIGLQVHGVGGITKPEKFVKFKNIRIKTSNLKDDIWKIRDDLKIINLN